MCKESFLEIGVVNIYIYLSDIMDKETEIKGVKGKEIKRGRKEKL